MTYNIRETQEDLYTEYKKNGYLKSWSAKNPLDKVLQKKLDIAELGLIVTEVSEAMEELRKINGHVYYEHLAEECTDIIIRTINFMSRKGLDLETAIYLKNKKNLIRGKLHGKDV